MINKEDVQTEFQQDDVPVEVENDEQDPVSASEEEHEPEHHESSEEETEKKPKKDKSLSLRKRLNDVQREKYQLIDEMQRLREEAEQLRNLSHIASQAATYHYDDNVLLNYENAKKKIEKAIEEGDVKAQVEANAELAYATTELNNAKQRQVQQNLYNNYYGNQNYQQPMQQSNQSYEYEAKRWVDQNPWFDKNSEEYSANEDLANAVENHANMIENSLYQRNLGHLIGTRQYFNEIDGFINQYRNHYQDQRQQSNNPNRELRMKPSNNYVAPANSAGSTYGPQRSQSSQTQVRLSADEKAMAKSLGVSESQFIKSKVSETKKMKQLYNSGQLIKGVHY